MVRHCWPATHALDSHGICRTLQQGPEQVAKAVALLHAYDLSRDDWEAINEVCQLRGQSNPFVHR